jgi:hypothetical protein
MVVTITYEIKNGQKRSKSFIRDSVKEALAFFNWRYGHKVTGLEAK